MKQAVEIFGKPFMLVFKYDIVSANHFGLDTSHFSETKHLYTGL